jgi:hypothetical protein
MGLCDRVMQSARGLCDGDDEYEIEEELERRAARWASCGERALMRVNQWRTRGGDEIVSVSAIRP